MTALDERFVREYLIDLDAKNAALRAGYKPGTAKNAYKWLSDGKGSKPQVKAAIEKAEAERAVRTGINQDRVLRELARVAFADVTDVVDTETMRIRPDADREDTAAISSVRVKCGRIDEREVRMHDKVHALELMGKHLGMFKDKMEIEGNVPVVIAGGDLLED